MSGRGSQPVDVSSLSFFSFLFIRHLLLLLSWLELHTFKCCDLYCLEDLPVHLKIETGLCYAILVVAAVTVVTCGF